MLPPGPEPTDSWAVAWLRTLIHDMDGRGDDDRDALLDDLLFAAWPTPWTQDQ